MVRLRTRKTTRPSTSRPVTYKDAVYDTLKRYGRKSFTVDEICKDARFLKMSHCKSPKAEAHIREVVFALVQNGLLAAEDAEDGRKRYKFVGKPKTTTEGAQQELSDDKHSSEVGRCLEEHIGDIKILTKDEIILMFLQRSWVRRPLAGIPEKSPAPTEVRRQASPTPTDVPEISDIPDSSGIPNVSDVLDVASTISFGIESEGRSSSFGAWFQQSLQHPELTSRAITFPSLSRHSTRSHLCRSGSATYGIASLGTFSGNLADVMGVDSSHAPGLSGANSQVFSGAEDKRSRCLIEQTKHLLQMILETVAAMQAKDAAIEEMGAIIQGQLLELLLKEPAPPQAQDSHFAEQDYSPWPPM